MTNNMESDELLLKLFELLKDISPDEVKLKNLPSDNAGYYNPVQKQIGIKKGLGQEANSKSTFT